MTTLFDAAHRWPHFKAELSLDSWSRLVEAIRETDDDRLKALLDQVVEEVHVHP